MVTITERAAAKVRQLLEAESDPALTALRVAVEGGGCSGFQYALGFDAGALDAHAERNRAAGGPPARRNPRLPAAPP